MKSVILIIFILLSNLVTSQVLDPNNIDYTLLNKKIFDKVNNYRKGLKLDVLYFSETIKTNVSVINVGKMVEENRLYHPGYSITDETFVSNLSTEYKKLTSNQCSPTNESSCWISNNGEIALFVGWYTSTYDDFAQMVLDGWLSSAPHKKIIETSYKNTKNYSGLASCYVGRNGNSFYVVFNFMQLMYM